jgi:hypothetical protein
MENCAFMGQRYELISDLFSGKVKRQFLSLTAERRYRVVSINPSNETGFFLSA